MRVHVVKLTSITIGTYLAGLLVILCAAAPASADMADELEDLTGEHTRIVWLRGAEDTRDRFGRGEQPVLMGFDSRDGKGERIIVSRTGEYVMPYLTPSGDRVVFTVPDDRKSYIVDFDGSNLRDLVDGNAVEVWRDPETGVEWVYVQVGGRKGQVRRHRLDNPEQSELVWDQTPIAPHNFQVSADGTRAGTLFPHPHGGIAELPNREWKRLGKGCWPSLAPDNSYLCWIFNGGHRDITMYNTREGGKWKVDLRQAPGINRDEVYFPRWTNHVQYLTMSGPFMGKGGPEAAEIHVGRFDESFRSVEKWVKLTDNRRGDFYPDVWIAGGENAIAARFQQGAILSDAAPDRTNRDNSSHRGPQLSDVLKHTEWPGDQSDLVFLWENSDAANQIVVGNDKPNRHCRAVARGRAVFGRFYEMDLGGGAVVAEETDEALLEACKASGELTLEATITPGNVTQGGPARIVTFSEGSGARNFTLGQEGATVLLRLRTPNTGEQGSNPQTDLFEVEAGRTYHVVVSYRPGSLSCYVDGKRVLETDRVSGDFSNWEPMHLLFGDEWDGGRDWSGKLEGVAIYSRAVSEAEARHKHRLYAQRLADREPINRLIVRGELKEITPTPTVEDLQEYSRGLVIYSYEIRDVLEGREEAKKIQVAHWALLDREKLPQIGDRKVGQVYDLQLENFDRHPQLEAERSFNDCEDFDIPLYYDIAGRGVEASPTMLAYEAAPETPKLHLRVNCAGPSMDGWESDDKYVAREERGDEFRFKRTADVSAVPDPAPVDVYKTVRHRNHRYRFDVPDGEYLVRLHFTDDFDPEGEIRRMDFVIENERALKEFNVVKAAGGVGRAVVREIPVRVADGNGLEIKGEDRTGGDVFAAGIEIVSR